MHKIGALLLLIFFIILFIFLGWDDDASKDASIPVENTTDIFTEDKTDQHDARFKLKKPKKSIKIRHTPTTFTLTDTKELNHTVTLSDQNIVFQGSEKPIVLLNLFATWCLPCIGEIP
ncbi:MAG TPA: hypothetical protein VLL31_02325, partial [Sulfurovum sp.]|nr:hypothetical protein [Sulfurovum sp.]